MTKKKDVLDYNSVGFDKYFEYSDSSPTKLTWIVKRAQRCPIGSAAGSFCTDVRTKQKSCSRVKLDGVNYLVHRIIWVLFNGSIDAEFVIDHIDGNPWNNTISNLRLTTQKENSRNSRLFSSNTTGIVGVSLRNTAGYMYYAAQYRDQFGNNVQKVFSINKYGEERAKLMAIEWRDSKIQNLESLGIFYSERHGT